MQLNIEYSVRFYNEKGLQTMKHLQMDDPDDPKEAEEAFKRFVDFGRKCGYSNFELIETIPRVIKTAK